MCGRYVASRPVSELADLLDAREIEPAPPLRALDDGSVPPARWNVAPQAAVWAMTHKRPDAESEASPASGEPVRRLAQYQWGLVPSWAKEPSVGARMFNARAEGIETKPAFRAAIQKRRCIIPADAFYEWAPAPAATPGVRGKPRKQPWCFRPTDGTVIAFAGLYEAWKPKAPATDGTEPGWLMTCTIITTEANELMSPIHNRMPVILTPDNWDLWLARTPLDEDVIGSLLVPAGPDVLVAYRVSDLVSNSRNEGPELEEPLHESAGPVDGQSFDRDDFPLLADL
ncbi:MAG TPA: SOS response-associated peptidase [Acidimicrobiales bacterium]|nr:SOS response-associated peptidase [Acidimicrobiales bacterium]